MISDGLLRGLLWIVTQYLAIESTVGIDAKACGHLGMAFTLNGLVRLCRKASHESTSI